MGLIDKVTNAWFASVTPRSAGFSALDMRAMHAESDAVTTALMFIGSASGSTGGGIKVNTIAVLLLVVVATATRRSEPEAFGRRIAVDTIARAVTVLVVSALAVFSDRRWWRRRRTSAAGGAVRDRLRLRDGRPLDRRSREARGPDEHRPRALMFLGRVGPIALVILLFGRAERSDPDPAPGADCAGGLMTTDEEG